MFATLCLLSGQMKLDLSLKILSRPELIKSPKDVIIANKKSKKMKMTLEKLSPWFWELTTLVPLTLVLLKMEILPVLTSPNS